MPTKMYALARNGPKRLQLSWGLGWRNFIIRLDGLEIAQIHSAQQLRQINTFDLDVDSKLTVVLDGNKLNVSLNGWPVPGTPGDPVRRWTTSYSTIGWVAGLSILTGIALQSSKATPGSAFAGTFSIVAGMVFAILAYCVWCRSRAALWVAVGLYALDTLSLFVVALAGNVFSMVGIIVHILFLFFIYGGFEGLDGLDAETYYRAKEVLPPMLGGTPQVDKRVTHAAQIIRNGGDR
jgi:hypothetical protein